MISYIFKKYVHTNTIINAFTLVIIENGFNLYVYTFIFSILSLIK